MNLSLEEAQQRLQRGEVVALPTETVYGLAASLSHKDAIDQVFRLKKRPQTNPLTVHLSSKEEVKQYTATLPDSFETLASTFWPGPLTLVLPILPDRIPPQVTAGSRCCGFRVPNHPLTLKLLRAVGPVVMPSANLSGKLSATRKEHVEEDFGKQFPILDGGPCTQGVESTILIDDKGTWKLLRKGALPQKSFAPLLGYLPELTEGPASTHPHYQPKTKLHLTTEITKDLEGVLLGFSDRSYPKKCQLISLGDSHQPKQVEENLYAALRRIDQIGCSSATIDFNIPKTSDWDTIRERLLKASL